MYRCFPKLHQNKEKRRETMALAHRRPDRRSSHQRHLHLKTNTRYQGLDTPRLTRRERTLIEAYDFRFNTRTRFERPNMT